MNRMLLANYTTEEPRNLTNFEPISLYTILYKIVSKTAANRFQQVLDCCIDEAQNAFVPRCLVTNNVLLAYKILHSFKQKRMGENVQWCLS
ncbi:reverse transcriptase [Gossypium australe]|uniref:Reverse transcriptase n=1 Tax=Gossypium australe TaxID=47621 RepID=A0A5B6VXT5_9ROSI|nr:reverse transcriptase [Gossypium australe]